MTLRRWIVSVCAAFLCCATSFAIENAPERGKVDMDGVWDFAFDTNNVGETEEWFAVGKALPLEAPEGSAPKVLGKIVVPGSWDAQGYGGPSAGNSGTPQMKVKHNAVGKGWYKKTVTIPADWNPENSIYFTLTGISRYAKVWVNGKSIGAEAIGCIGKHEWNASELVKPGDQAEVVVCVDSDQRWDVDPLLGASALNDYLEIEWGGIWGHIYFESRPKTRIDSLYLRTKLGKRAEDSPYGSRATCVVNATILDENKSKNLGGFVRLEVVDKRGSVVANSFKAFKNLDFSEGSRDLEFNVVVPNAKLWSPDAPYLYTVRVSLLLDGSSDVLESKYGMREIKFDGARVFLNGKALFLRGYGDDHIYPNEFSMPTSKQMYVDRLRAIKSFGFNHCRHHSCVLPCEYYDACDEVGMLPNAEMLIGYPQQLPGQGDLWKRNVPAETDPEVGLALLRERFEAVVKEYRNHPSIFAWVGGNELCMLGWDVWTNMPLGRQFREIAKKWDPDRYYTDCDGDWLHEYKAFGGRDVEDFYSILFDEWSNPVLNRKKFDVDVVFDKPAISHESGNFLTFSRPDQIALFENTNYVPFWMTDGAAKLEELGLSAEVEDWAKASEKLYLLSHKYNVEGVRLNANLSGYHWWLINDYWTTSNGIFDLFFRPKTMIPDDILPFNNDLVLLQKNFDFSYRSGDQIEFKPFISNFSGDDLFGTLEYMVLDHDGNVVYEWREDVKSPAGELNDYATSAFIAPEVENATILTLRARFTAGGKEYVNSWSATLCPKVIAPNIAKPIYADETSIAFFPAEWGVKPISELQGDYPTDAIYAVSWTSPKVLSAVQQGARLFNFNAAQFLSSLNVRFQQTWWKAGDSEVNNNTGTYVYPNAITDAVVEKNYCGAAWASLLDGAHKYNVEGRVRPEIFVRALSSLVMVRDEALLFEFGVGAGKIVISGLNHGAAVDSPINAWILARSLEELASDAPAKVQWEADGLLPPIKTPEGTLLGIIEVVQSAETSAWNSYRSLEGNISNWICRQKKLGNDVVWKTIPVESVEGETATFIFAGNTGFASQPKTEGFMLSFNGVDLIKFDCVDVFDGATTRFEWKSEDGAAALTFDCKRELGTDDKYGVFTLTVPASAVAVGASQVLSVRSLGEGSSRWFSIVPYTDFSDL